MKHYLLAILCLLLVSMGMASSADASEVKITSPQNGATIPQASIDIEGTSTDIPAGQALWIMVYPHGVNRYYPQDKRDLPIVMMANGDWSAQAIVGSDTDSGLEFKLFAVLADEKAIKAIIDYLDASRAKGSWDGLVQLPDGATICDKVSVTRK
jgi:hypothetical protein